MNKNLKGLLFIIISLVATIIGYLFMQSESSYSIVCYTLTGVFFLNGLYFLLKSNNPEKIYADRIKNIIKVYDSILVKNNKLPSLKGKNVVKVLSIDDLIDAQYEIKKAICYTPDKDSCSFILFDNDEAYVYVDKVNNNVECEIDKELKKANIRKKSLAEMESEMLQDIDNTTVIKFSDNKCFKMSPVKPKQRFVIGKYEDVELI